MTTHIDRPLSDEELLGVTFAPEAPPPPRLYPDWDWSAPDVSRDEVSTEVTYLLKQRATLAERAAELAEAGTPDPYFAQELAKVEGELALLTPTAERLGVPLEVKQK
ncbi:hypothetical protein D3C72_1349970 [compost metagenome]